MLKHHPMHDLVDCMDLYKKIPLNLAVDFKHEFNVYDLHNQKQVSTPKPEMGKKLN